MIFDELKYSHRYAPLGTGIARALKFLQTTDLRKLPEGRCPIDGEALYAVVLRYRTKPKSKCAWEAHRRYIDVQYIVSGSERMGCAPLSRMRVSRPYQRKTDCLLLDGSGDFISVHEGMFALFMPEDVHMPGLMIGQPAQVLKVVVKVAAPGTVRHPQA